MPVLTNIIARIDLDSNWLEVFAQNRSRAKEISQGLALLHVIDGRTDVARSIVEEVHYLRVSALGTSLLNTLAAEDAYALGRCLYFYAGRAYPLVGGVAFAFPAGSENPHSGHATPFDTGGIFKGKILTNLPVAELQAFVQDSLIPLRDWRLEFITYLAAYSNPLSAYWDGRPWRPDPEGIFHAPSNTWRAWCFEIRFREDHDFLNASFWCASEIEMESYRQEMQNSPHKVDVLASFLAKGLTAEGDLDYIRVVEHKAREDVKLP